MLVLLSFGLLFISVFLEVQILNPIGFLLLGLLFVLFHRDIATERFNIDKNTKNKFLAKYLFANETKDRNSGIVLIVGVCFLVVGCLSMLAILS